MSGTATYRGLILDLDGTLVDSHDYTFAAFRFACAPFGVQPSNAEIYAAFGPDEGVILAQLVGAAQAGEAHDRLQNYYRQHVHDVQAHPALRRLLQDCGAHGRPCGLFTGRGRAATQLILDALGLAEHFIGIFAGDDGPPKPAPDGVRVLAQSMGCALGEVILVGDSTLDMEAAIAAGAGGRLAVWYARGASRSSHPAPRVQHPDELHGLLGLPGPTS